MSVSGIGSAGGFDLAKMASNIASNMMKKLDTNGDGSIDKTEFVTGLTAKGVSATDAGKQFDSLDTKKTGKISQTDIESAIKAGKGGPPPGGAPAGGHGAGGAGQSSGAASTSSAKTYDKKDTNKDGTVSSVEELAYDLAHPAQGTADTTKSAPSQNVGNNVNAWA